MRKYLLIGLLVTVVSLLQGQGKSFTLDEAVAYGLENSNAIKMGNIDVESANYDIKEVKSIGMPSVTGGVDYSYYFFVPKQPVEDFISPTVYQILEAESLATAPTGPPAVFEFGFVQPHALTGKIGVNQLIFDGSYLYAIKGAKLYKELSRKQMDATEQTIKADVTKAYLAVLIARANLQNIEDNMKTLTVSLREVKAMYEEGFMESLDVDRLQLSYDELSIQQENLTEFIKLSENLLKFQMGYPIDDDIDLTENIEGLVTKFDAEVQTTYELDPNKRAEFRIMNASQELNEVDLKRNKAAYYPSIAGFASYQQSLQRQNLFDNDEVGFLPTGVVGVGINIPIYDGGEKSAKIQKVKLSMEKLELQKLEFERGMKLQVRNAEVAYNNAKRMLENRQKSLSMNESIYERTKIKFKEGVGSSVEVTQAENSYYSAQNQYISALYDLLQAKVDLDIALGTL